MTLSRLSKFSEELKENNWDIEEFYDRLEEKDLEILKRYKSRLTPKGISDFLAFCFDWKRMDKLDAVYIALSKKERVKRFVKLFDRYIA